MICLDAAEVVDVILFGSGRTEQKYDVTYWSYFSSVCQNFCLKWIARMGIVKCQTLAKSGASLLGITDISIVVNYVWSVDNVNVL